MIPTRYVTTTADPAWPYRDGLRMKSGKVRRSAQSHYQTMSVPEICALGQRGPLRIAGYNIAVDAFLWLWVTNPVLIDGTAARVAKAWGFKPAQLVTWIKGRVVGEMVEIDGKLIAHGKVIAHVGMGHLTRGCTEHLLLCTRGRTKHLLKNKSTPNFFIAPRTTHSTKPQAAYDLIEQLTPGPNLELFARKHRENWTCFGNELPEVAA